MRAGDPSVLPAELEAFARHWARGGDAGEGIIDIPAPHSTMAMLFAITAGTAVQRHPVTGAWLGAHTGEAGLRTACRSLGLSPDATIIATLDRMSAVAMGEMVGE